MTLAFVKAMQVLEPVFTSVFSANFAADCVKNPCRAKARLRIFAYSATKLCSKIRTHFL